MMTGESQAIEVAEESSHAKGKTPVSEAPLVVSTKATHDHTKAVGGGGGWKKGIAILDFILRLCAITAALAAAGTMGTTNQTLPFFTQFFQFQASYDDLPAFTFFVVANAITSGYLVLSLPFSVVAIVRPHAVAPRLLLITFDTVALTLTTAAAAAAAAIVYLAHNGNKSANWVAICQQFDDFCRRISGAVVASFVGAVLLVFLVVLSSLALKRH